MKQIKIITISISSCTYSRAVQPHLSPVVRLPPAYCKSHRLTISTTSPPSYPPLTTRISRPEATRRNCSTAKLPEPHTCTCVALIWLPCHSLALASSAARQPPWSHTATHMQDRAMAHSALCISIQVLFYSAAPSGDSAQDTQWHYLVVTSFL